MKNLQAKLGAIALALLVLLATLPSSGCSKSTVVELVSVLGSATSNIANLEGNPALAAQLKADTAAAVSAISNWQSGSPATVAIEALNILAADLSLIPGTSAYAPLIDLAIGTIDSILALIPSSAVSVHASRSVHLQNAPKTKSQFKVQWDGIVAQHPALSSAAI